MHNRVFKPSRVHKLEDPKRLPLAAGCELRSQFVFPTLFEQSRAELCGCPRRQLGRRAVPAVLDRAPETFEDALAGRAAIEMLF